MASAMEGLAVSSVVSGFTLFIAVEDKREWGKGRILYMDQHLLFIIFYWCIYSLVIIILSVFYYSFYNFGYS